MPLLVVLASAIGAALGLLVEQFGIESMAQQAVTAVDGPERYDEVRERDEQQGHHGQGNPDRSRNQEEQQKDQRRPGLDYENVRTGEKGRIDVAEGDFVFDTNGSITDSSSIGDLDTPIVEDMRYAPSALLWKQATEHFYDLGNPDKFFGDREQSEWTSFTVTTSSHELINEISRITKQLPGNALNTFVDSNVLLSIVVHHQPHYHAQKENEGVFWGYCLFPRKNGDYVKKPFIEMTGREMLEETLGHLEALDENGALAARRQEIMDSVVNSIPSHMPYASALFNRRAVGDRPLVVPKHSKNLAFISQFAELPFDMVFTEQYSVRCAQVAVYKFLGIPEDKLTKMHHYEKDPKVLAKAAVTMFR